MSYSKIFEIDQDIDLKVKNFMIDFILELKKKEYHSDTMKIKKDFATLQRPTTPLEIKVYEFIQKMLPGPQETPYTLTTNDSNFNCQWKKVKNEFHEKYIDLWEPLNLDYEQTVPDMGKIYKKLYLPKNNNLRYCMATCMVGFYNFSKTPLKIRWSYFTTNVGPECLVSALENYTPLFFSSLPYDDFKILDTSHQDFYILYCWLPNSQKLTQTYWFEHQGNVYISRAGTIQKTNTEDIKEFSRIPYTLSKEV